MGLSVSNTHFEHKSLHKYTKVVRSQDRMKVMSMIDLVVVKKAMMRCKGLSDQVEGV